MNIHIIPILQNNYCAIIQGEGHVAIVDPGEANPILNFLKHHQIIPTHILNTHHHWDHVNGNDAIINEYGCDLIAPAYEADKIQGITQQVKDGDHLSLCGDTIQVIHTPGHTMGHVIYYLEQEKILFSGDTLFSMGCGRLFEGTAEDMFHSFQKIKALPPETMIYCGHEYTSTNAQFTQKNSATETDALKNRIQRVHQLRQENQPTIPFTLQEEQDTSLFMQAQTIEEFAAYRAARDQF